MKSITKIVVGISCITVFVAWWCVPMFNRWKADQLVDDLCAKDGGIKVYETVTLPAARFNQWGQFEVRDPRYLKQGDEYYLTNNTTDIKGESTSTNIGTLAIFKQRFQILRLKDKKIMGEIIIYARTGGDSPGPWHPSSYSCPQNKNLEGNIFIKSDLKK